MIDPVEFLILACLAALWYSARRLPRLRVWALAVTVGIAAGAVVTIVV